MKNEFKLCDKCFAAREVEMWWVNENCDSCKHNERVIKVLRNALEQVRRSPLYVNEEQVAAALDGS